MHSADVGGHSALGVSLPALLHVLGAKIVVTLAAATLFFGMCATLEAMDREAGFESQRRSAPTRRGCCKMRSWRR